VFLLCCVAADCHRLSLSPSQQHQSTVAALDDNTTVGMLGCCDISDVVLHVCVVCCNLQQQLVVVV